MLVVLGADVFDQFLLHPSVTPLAPPGLIEGVGMIKRHTRPNPGKQIKGGIAEKESSIAISNVMMLTSGGVATRVSYKVDGPKRVRVARKGGEILDKK